jgi:hypothetical protein
MIICLSDYEGFSVSTAEAVIHGNFVAARKVGDLPNYLNDESTIWLDSLSERDWSLFTSKVITVLSDKEECKSRRNKSMKYTTNLLKDQNYKRSFIYAINKIIGKN